MAKLTKKTEIRKLKKIDIKDKHENIDKKNIDKKIKMTKIPKLKNK